MEVVPRSLKDLVCSFRSSPSAALQGPNAVWVQSWWDRRDRLSSSWKAGPDYRAPQDSVIHVGASLLCRVQFTLVAFL